MRTNVCAKVLLILAVFFLPAACADSGGGVGGSGIVSRGAISEMGSIEVNGTVFDTTKAVVVVNGEIAGRGDTAVLEHLSVGQVVTVEGTMQAAEESTVAARVVYRTEVTGPVSAVSDGGSDERELTVMGQTVVVNTITTLKNIDMEALVPGRVVEVSGFYDDAGTVWATFVEEKEDAYTGESVYEVRGVVTVHSPREKTFQINGLDVNYASATTGALAGGKPENGMLVEAAGTVDAAFTLMLAERVAPGDDIEAENADEVEVAGFVTATAAAGEFTVGNQVVVVEKGAVFVDGVQADVVTGARLEAEGELVDGILRADEIEFWGPDQFEIEGPVTQIAFVLPATGEAEFIVAGSQVVVTSAATTYEDGNLADIEIDVKVEIKGRLQNGVMVADKVSFEGGASEP